MANYRVIRVLLLLVIGLAIASLIAVYQIKTDRRIGQGVVAEDFGGPFTLQNQDGETVTQEDFEGEYRLIYFGFTYCPAICPTELQKISAALKQLGEKGENILPVFISVDPERDTIQVMKNYVEMFHPRLVGLTGTVQQVEQAKKSYKIYSAKVKDDTMTEYTVDHSSFIYFMNPEGDLLRIFKTEDTAEDMVNVIRQYMGS
jgi:protein SCO1/2